MRIEKMTGTEAQVVKVERVVLTMTTEEAVALRVLAGSIMGGGFVRKVLTPLYIELENVLGLGATIPSHRIWRDGKSPTLNAACSLDDIIGGEL